MRLSEGGIVDGRYRLVERIGSGGMADVWRARDEELSRDVALKVLHENFARDAEFVERFRREASAAAGLQHPNVVAVYDRGSWEDTYYIAMELVEGSSLRDLIQRGLSQDEAIEVARQILTAAGFAHGRGIVHRDLKPLNVLIDREGRVRVTDFGIARAGGSEITRTGSVMGTAQYLSPEQAQGFDVGPASDIYSIGVMLFEMLCGRVPFEGESPVTVAMKQVADDPPRPRALNEAVSPALEEVVLRSLAKDPANRYASAAEMTAALDAAQADPNAGGQGGLASKVADEDASSRRWWWIGAGVAALLIAGLLAFLLTRPDPVEVPDVTGEQEAAATLELRDAGFEVAVDRSSNTVPEGEVIEQDPRGGSEADEGSTVTITVSLGPSTAPVPDVRGMAVPRAKRQLRDAGFEAEVRRRPSESVAEGRVISSDPSAGTSVAEGETVTLFVSSGVPTKEVPDVVGLDRSAAVSQLRSAGFIVSASGTESEEEKGQVLSQDPPAGESVQTGSRISITYSTGISKVELPDLVGQKSGYAERRLAKAGLESAVIKRETSDPSEDGIVLAQAPSPGTQLSPGERVTLTVGKYVASDDGQMDPDGDGGP